MQCFLLFSITTALIAFHVSNTAEENAFVPDVGTARFGILTNDQTNNSLVDNLDVQSKLRWEYATKSGYRIGIYDNTLTLAQLKMLRGLTTHKLGSWSYRIQEAQFVKDGQNYLSTNNIPWHNELDSFKFSETNVGKKLEKVVMKFAGKESMHYYLYKAVGHILRRGDFPKVNTDACCEDDEMTMMIYLNPKWRKNDYGDLYLYDDDKEIVAGVVPRYGRVVVWQSSIPYLPRPPSVAFKPGQLFLHISFTKNQTKANEMHSKWLENEVLLKSIRNKGFFTRAEQETPNGEVLVQSHLVSEAKTKNGKRIVVFDGLFSKDDLDNLRRAILNYGVYYYDDSYDEESDNVQWIAGFEVDDYIKSNMWNTTQQVAKFVSGGHVDWFPYDISCNLIRNADATQIHHDCEVHEDEWTFLLYLNPNWTINNYGETVFYERNEDDTEIVTEVLPKYGRVVIFQGIIPHSARPPSTNFSGARLSFAVKLSRNEWAGRRKAFQEEFRHFSAVKATLGAFKSMLVNGNDEGPNDDRFLSSEATQSHDKRGEEEYISDPEMMEFNDSDLEIMEGRLEMLLKKDGRDIKDMRTLVRDLRKSHLQAREDIGELFYQVL